VVLDLVSHDPANFVHGEVALLGVIQGHTSR
jgi:hypothetical protein